MISSHNAVNALRAIKGRLVDPMNNLKNWNRGDPCRSNWTGVFCHKVNDDKFLHVTELYDQHLCLIYSLYLNFQILLCASLAYIICNELSIEEKSAYTPVLRKYILQLNADFMCLLGKNNNFCTYVQGQLKHELPLVSIICPII